MRVKKLPIFFNFVYFSQGKLCDLSTPVWRKVSVADSAQKFKWHFLFEMSTKRNKNCVNRARWIFWIDWTPLEFKSSLWKLLNFYRKLERTQIHARIQSLLAICDWSIGKPRFYSIHFSNAADADILTRVQWLSYFILNKKRGRRTADICSVSTCIEHLSLAVTKKP